MTIPRTIAIDGPAASGKSTLGERLARRLGYLYFDTGVMYRAVTLKALQTGTDVYDEPGVTRLAETIMIDVRQASVNDGRMYDVLLDGVDVTWEIRSAPVAANVSVVSTYAGVRKAMTEQQRRIGLQGNVVMVGRDIGTVVLPDADLKIYLDASAEERARRRFVEEQARGIPTSYEDILDNVRTRDKIDSSREVAPLRPAEDAIILNSDHLDADGVLEAAIRLVEAA
ncbi:MAG: (d)CMP kinase [Anaerolineaceae bacterium]|nr:(d)CMP kinase [Anaerolineaceae bacterium]